MEVVRIEEIPQKLGQKVTILGWLHNKRSSGGIQFLLIRDGSGLIQGVVTKKDEEAFALADRLTQESAIKVEGVAKEDARAPTGYELSIHKIELVHHTEGYPITPKEHGAGFLLDHRHLWMRSPRQAAILRVRHELLQAIRDFFHERGFVATEAPIFTPLSVEGTTTLFEMEYFGEKAYLSQSGQLYLEAAAMALGLVYWIGPAFRAERSKTRKHLIEFWMAEAEMAYWDYEQNLRLQEELVKYIIARVLERRSQELEARERDTTLLERAVEEPFPRITYAEALDLLQSEGLSLEWGEDFGAPHEEALGDHFKLPVFIEKFPAKMKAFYMQPDPQNPEVVLAADLIAPEGYGELIGGSERIHDEELLLKKLDEFGLPKEPYQWYIDLRRYGSVPHSGFGLGIERTVAWIVGARHLRECIPFPRMLYRLSP
jgi:asparaginyl-tRNA synthetase